MVGTIGNENIDVWEKPITVDMFGNVFYHDEACAGDDNIYAFLNSKLSKAAKLFVASAVASVTQSKYSYQQQFRQGDANKLSVYLPCTPDGDPDWAYMESYMANIEAKVAESLTLLQAAKDAEKKKLDTREWGEFRVGELFAQERGKEKAPKQNEPGDCPLIQETNNNNGFDRMVVPTKVIKGNSITVSINYAQNVFYQADDFCASVNIAVLRNNHLNRYNSQFVCSVLRNAHQKFDYTSKISLTADPEQDADAALVSIEQEAALASDDEDDAAALERELSALEATLPTPTTFDPSGIEEDEDDSESFDMDSWLAEDVPENEPDIETEIELETEEPELSVEPKQESAETDSEPPAKKEIAPKPAGMESDQNGKKDKTPSDTENPVKVNAFTKQENPVPVEEKPAPKQKPAKASKAKTPKTPESGTSKPATAPAPAPAKKPEADNRNDASLFGRGFQNRTTKGSGGGKKKANQSKKPEPYSEGEQMRFDGI